MQTEIVLEDCPHCGGEARFAGLADWPYLSNIVFCPSCLVKGPQAPDISLRLCGINGLRLAPWRMMLWPRPVPSVRRLLLLRVIMVGVMNLGMRARCTLRPVRIV